MKTKRSWLCILLVAVMMLSMLLSGCSNAEKTAEKIRPTRARDESTVPTETEAPTEPQSPLPEYLEILAGIMESSGYAEANNQQEFRGKLCDWDEDGEDEMLLRYGTSESLFEIWDYVNNSAVRTLSGSFGTNAGPGFHAHLYVVTYGEQPAIVLFDQKGGGGDSFTLKPLWSLYALVGDELQCMHQAGLVDAYDTQHDTSTKTFTLDGKDIPEAEFNAIDWVIKDAPPLFAAGRAYEDENGQITDGSYEFVDLSDEIEAAIAAENGEPVESDPGALVEDAFSYEDTSTPDFPHKFAIPKINIDSSEIDDLNTQIYDAMYPTIQDEIDKFEENGFWFYNNISYEWAVNEDVLSLMIHWDLPAESGAGKWDIYNISVSGKRIMTKEELLSAYGISEAEYREKVKQALVSEYLDYAMGWYYESNGADDFFLKQLNNTGADSNIDIAQPFINKDGQLCAVGECYSLAAGNHYPHQVNLETFELSEYYGTDFTVAAAEDVNAIYEDFLTNGTYLASWESGDVDFGDPTSYCIQDLNNDGSPELCLDVPTFNGYYFAKVYTYDAKAKEVALAGDVYYYGSLSYSEKYNAICANSLSPTMGGSIWFCTQLQGTDLVKLFDLAQSYSASGYVMADSAETTGYYYRKGTGKEPEIDLLSDPKRDSYEISEEEYNEYVDKNCTMLSFESLDD